MRSQKSNGVESNRCANIEEVNKNIYISNGIIFELSNSDLFGLLSD